MAETHEGLSEITGMIGSTRMVLINSVFHWQNDFFDIYLHFGHAPTKMFVIHFLDRKSLKNLFLKWLQIVYLPGPPTSIGPTLLPSQKHKLPAAPGGYLTLFHNEDKK